MIHTTMCQKMGWQGDHTDAAKRLRDTYALHRVADPIGNLGKWFAVNLGTAENDGVLYDSRLDAVMHQHHNERFYAFVQIVPSTMTYCDAEYFLSAHRKMREKGITMPARDEHGGGRGLIPRVTAEDQIGQMRALIRGGMPPNLHLPERKR